MVVYPEEFPECKDLNRVFTYVACHRALRKSPICKKVNIPFFMCKQRINQYCPKLHHIPSLPLCTSCFSDFDPHPCTDQKIIVSLDKKQNKNNYLQIRIRFLHMQNLFNTLDYIIRFVFYKKLPKHFWHVPFKEKRQWVRYQIFVH